MSGASSLSSLTKDRVDVQLIVTESSDQDVDKLEYQKPAYVAVALIMGLTLFAVVFPLFVTSNMLGMNEARNITMSQRVMNENTHPPCNDHCKIVIAESIPENVTFAPGSPMSLSTYEAWKGLIASATQSIDLVAFYWTLQGDDLPHPDQSYRKGDEIFKSLYNAVKNRGIKMRIAQNLPSGLMPQNDSKLLEEAGAEVRSLNFPHWFNGNGILHTKMWLIDGKHFYVGSANMDWRSLTQVKEMGAAVYDCSCLAEDMSKLFSVYWDMGKPGAELPDSWPAAYATRFNAHNPMQVQLNHSTSHVFISSSPPEFCPRGRTSDVDSILHVIHNARKYVYIAVMDYFPSTLYTKPRRYWDVIDKALRQVAFDKGIHVRVLASNWTHTRQDLPKFLLSLQSLNGAPVARHHEISIETKLFHVPVVTPAQAEIPYARVNHNKYMVTDNTAYIGTSNWSGDYFLYTGGIGLIVNQTVNQSATKSNASSVDQSMQRQLSAIFERDWNSCYALPVGESFDELKCVKGGAKDEL